MLLPSAFVSEVHDTCTVLVLAAASVHVALTSAPPACVSCRYARLLVLLTAITAATVVFTLVSLAGFDANRVMVMLTVKAPLGNKTGGGADECSLRIDGAPAPRCILAATVLLAPARALAAQHTTPTTMNTAAMRRCSPCMFAS